MTQEEFKNKSYKKFMWSLQKEEEDKVLEERANDPPRIKSVEEDYLEGHSFTIQEDTF